MNIIVTPIRRQQPDIDGLAAALAELARQLVGMPEADRMLKSNRPTREERRSA